jgi:hypothetical protein
MKYTGKKKMSAHGKKQGPQRNASVCKLCGTISLGRGVRWHVEKTHHMDYHYYCSRFQNFTMVITD